VNSLARLRFRQGADFRAVLRRETGKSRMRPGIKTVRKAEAVRNRMGGGRTIAAAAPKPAFRAAAHLERAGVVGARIGELALDNAPRPRGQ
jgi:hypothetical protein